MRLVEQEEVPAAHDDVHARVRQARGEQARVEQRHGGVVVAGHDQHGERDAVQPRQARPPRTSPVDGIVELAIRGHNVMKGYWRRADATAAAIDAGGWFRTGDLARMDEDGCFFIAGRKKEMLIRGGFNVYPREIEEVIYEHPAVAEAAVIGVPHPALGEEVAAAIALRPDADVTPEDIRDYAK